MYILVCADGSLYTGSALDPAVRLKLHNAGKASKYTRARRPVRLAYQEPCRDLSEAFRREYRIKKLTRAGKLSLIARGRVGRKNLSAD